MSQVKLETKVYEIDPRQLLQLPKNARYMTAGQQKQLSSNVETDGALTSVPLVYRRDGDTKATILSGNHRVASAIDADIPLIWVMEIITSLSDERQVAIALSHNSVTGQDDKSILLELYDSIGDLDIKAYSGLTDDDLKDFEPLNLSSVNTSGVQYEEIALLFLPEDVDVFCKGVERVAKSTRATGIAARFEDFDDFFEGVVRVKELRNVVNNAIAVRLMVDLANERLDQMEAEAGVAMNG